MILKTLSMGTFVLASIGLQSAHSACSGRLESYFRAGGEEYDPFAPIDLKRRQTVTVRNTGDQPCDYVLWFRRQPSEGRLSGKLTYWLQDLTGQRLTNAQIAASGSGAYLLIENVQPSQTSSTDYYVALPRGQFAYPGTYFDDNVTLTLHRRERSGSIGSEVLDNKQLQIAQDVQQSFGINLAGAGQAMTLDYGMLEDGKERSVVLQTRANFAYSMVIRSENRGIMKLEAEGLGGAWNWTVPYGLRVNGESISLQSAATLQHDDFESNEGQESHTLSFQIGATKNKQGGKYRDVITVEIGPKN
jgi:hypothetical protein